VNKALKYNIGSETIASLERAHAEVEAQQLPSHIQFGAGALSQLDPSQAPPGYHTAYAWQIVPFAPDATRKLNEIREPLADSILEKWREYAPNLTPTYPGQACLYGYDYVRELPICEMGYLHGRAQFRPSYAQSLRLPDTDPGSTWLDRPLIQTVLSPRGGYIAAGLIARISASTLVETH